MKTYRAYKVSLFIFLITFNNLSSCVNTRQKLAWWPCPSAGDVRRYFNRHPGIDTFCTCATKVLSCTSSIVAIVWITSHYIANQNYKSQSNQVDALSKWHMSNHMNCFNMHPSSISTDGHRKAIVHSITPALEASITKAIQDGEEKWATPPATQSGSIIRDPMLLGEQVKEKIIRSGWSEKSLEHYLDQGLNIEAKDGGGLTLFMLAVRNGNKPIARFLLNRGANVDAIDNYGETSLMRAVTLSDDEMVKFLIEHDADPCIPNNACKTPLDRISTHDLTKATIIIKALKEAIQKNNSTKRCRFL